jgi:hypothetical protein
MAAAPLSSESLSIALEVALIAASILASLGTILSGKRVVVVVVGDRICVLLVFAYCPPSPNTVSD